MQYLFGHVTGIVHRIVGSSTEAAVESAVWWFFLKVSKMLKTI